ncbi:MAG: DUF3592 domain-containing protein [Oscillospiraceae bacterium]|nr:DUF3592 domain-containing protein [Oscillospiraceae bacterium]
MKIKSAEGINNVIGVVFFLVGVLLVIVSIITFVGNKQFEANAETVMATITEIDTYRTRSNGKTKTHHNVFIEYEIDGKTYNRELNYYTASMYEGKEIEVMYNPDNPADARANDDFAWIILVFMGLIFGTLGGGLFFTNVIAGGKRKKLMENGDRVTGTITDVITVTNVKINGRHPYKAEIEVIDPYTSEKYLYSSKQVIDDISYMVGSTVDVYVDRDDKSKYYVDLDSVAADEYSDVKVHDFR